MTAIELKQLASEVYRIAYMNSGCVSTPNAALSRFQTAWNGLYANNPIAVSGTYDTLTERAVRLLLGTAPIAGCATTTVWDAFPYYGGYYRGRRDHSWTDWGRGWGPSGGGGRGGHGSHGGGHGGGHGRGVHGPGLGATTLRQLAQAIAAGNYSCRTMDPSVLAFQNAWRAFYPGHPVEENGFYGQLTAAAVSSVLGSAPPGCARGILQPPSPAPGHALHPPHHGPPHITPRRGLGATTATGLSTGQKLALFALGTLVVTVGGAMVLGRSGPDEAISRPGAKTYCHKGIRYVIYPYRGQWAVDFADQMHVNARRSELMRIAKEQIDAGGLPRWSKTCALANPVSGYFI